MRRLEREAVRLASFYAVRAETNKAVTRCQTPEEVFQALCRIAVEQLSLVGAWVSRIDDARQELRPVAAHGVSLDYVRHILISTDPARPEGRGPVAIAVREGRPEVVPDCAADPRTGPWTMVAAELGGRSSAAVPIRRAGITCGVLNLYAAERGYFDEALIVVLQALAGDISHALDNLDRDIRHREAEVRLRASEAKFRTLFEASRDATFLTRDGRFLECNPRTLELFGCDRDALIGQSPAAFWPEFQPGGESSHALCARYIGGALAGTPQQFEWRHRRADGTEFDTEVVLARVEIEGEMCVQAIVHDITARKASEVETSQQALRYRSFMRAALDGVHILDPQGRLIDANDRFLSMLGYDPANPPRLSVTDWDAEAHDSKVLLRIAGNTETAELFEAVHRRADGSTLPVEVAAIGVDLGGQRVIYCASRDVSERHRAEEERASLQRSLLQAQKMESVGRLAGAVAHDFNNMLTVMSGYASLLQASLAPDSRGAAQAAEIARAAGRAGELTRKLLIFSRRHPDEPKLVAIDEFLRQEARMVPRLIGEHIAVVSSPIANALVRIDPAQLAQVLMNLIVNARDAMPEGGTLTLKSRLLRVSHANGAMDPDVQPGEYVSLSVTDTGCGMSTEVQGRLFEPFFTTKPIGRGTGLGLATVYGIVKQAGGFVDVRSAPDEGTTMVVVLPRCYGEVEVAPLDYAPTFKGGTERILVVEDEGTVRELTELCLRQLGYTVLTAGSPAEAISMVRGGAGFDLVVSDVVMPGMNGRRMVHELGRIQKNFETLYMSGFADTGVAGTAEAAIDPTRFLAKPFSPQGLGQKVRELLDQHGAAGAKHRLPPGRA